MKLLALHLEGFGRLVGRDFAFSPGFNLIYGPNEAGKSTLQQAILALLYGFFDDGSITTAKRAAAAAWQPWQADAPYAGRLRYALADGQTFEVRRTFGPKPGVSLFLQADSAAPKDVSGAYRSASQGRLFFADAQLGLSKTVFENTCTVRQAELVALESSAAAITDTLTRLAASASADTNVADALAALEQALKEVGTERAWAKPLPQAQQKLKALEAERVKVQQARRELFSRIVEQQQVAARVQALEEEIARWAYLEQIAAAGEIRARLDVLEKAQAAVLQQEAQVGQWQTWASFPVQLRDEVLRLQERRTQMRQERTQSQPRAEQAQAALAAQRAKIAASEARIAALEDARSTPVAARAELQALAETWRRAQASHQAVQERERKAQALAAEAERRIAPERAALLPAVEAGALGLAQAQQQLEQAREKATAAAQALAQAEAEWARTGMSAAQFQTLEQTVHEIQSGARPAPKPHRGCRFWPFGKSNAQPDPTPTELVIYAQITPLHTALVQAQGDLESARRALDELETAARSRWGALLDETLSAAAFAALGARLERYQRAEAGLEQQHVTVAELQREVVAAQAAEAQALAALQSRLVSRGLPATDAQQALADFERQCQRHAELAREESALEHARSEARAYERELAAWQERQTALAQVEAELSAVLAQAEVSCEPETLEAGLARFAEGVANWQQWEKSRAAYEAALSHRDALLAQGDAAALAATWAESQAKLSLIQQEHPDWAALTPDQPPQQYAQKRQHAEQQRGTERETLARLRDEIQRAAESLRHPAELEEEIAALKAEVHRLERFRDALTLASAELAQANQEFQRQFAPKLESLMCAGLRQITDARYTQARVDASTLAVSLLAPERNEQVGVERLSTGTRDLVYLMLRMSIARLMSSTSERLPLLLDDPLVQYDRDRRDRALAFLMQAAVETQVLFFTKDAEILAQVEQNGADAARWCVLRLD